MTRQRDVLGLSIWVHSLYPVLFYNLFSRLSRWRKNEWCVGTLPNESQSSEAYGLFFVCSYQVGDPLLFNSRNDTLSIKDLVLCSRVPVCLCLHENPFCLPYKLWTNKVFQTLYLSKTNISYTRTKWDKEGWSVYEIYMECYKLKTCDILVPRGLMSCLEVTHGVFRVRGRAVKPNFLLLRWWRVTSTCRTTTPRLPFTFLSVSCPYGHRVISGQGPWVCSKMVGWSLRCTIPGRKTR